MQAVDVQREAHRRQLTPEGGYSAFASPDGKSILFTRLERTGVWQMSADGGVATLLVPTVRAAENANWRVNATGIYYVGSTADRTIRNVADGIRRGLRTGAIRPF